MCYVYLICDENNRSKIGLSDNPQKRLNQLQTGASSNLTLVQTHDCETRQRAQLFEKVMHKAFHDKKVRGEWFEMDIEEASSLFEWAVIRYEDDSDLALRHFLKG